MNEFGPHLTIDASQCNRDALVDYDLVFNLLNELPGMVGMTKMTLPYVVKWKDKFGTTPGVSGFVMIAESHISIHTFPDQDYVFIDFFSCQNFDYKKATKILVNAFGARKVVANVVKRGLNFPRMYEKEIEQ
ncbi:MAG: adenosylmethionine decarboxylase [Nanoarchaeota archaeon]